MRELYKNYFSILREEYRFNVLEPWVKNKFCGSEYYFLLKYILHENENLTEVFRSRFMLK